MPYLRSATWQCASTPCGGYLRSGGLLSLHRCDCATSLTKQLQRFPAPCTVKLNQPNLHSGPSSCPSRSAGLPVCTLEHRVLLPCNPLDMLSFCAFAHATPSAQGTILPRPFPSPWFQSPCFYKRQAVIDPVLSGLRSCPCPVSALQRHSQNTNRANSQLCLRPFRVSPRRSPRSTGHC